MQSDISQNGTASFPNDSVSKEENSEINMLVYMRKWQVLVGSLAEIVPMAEGTKCVNMCR